LVVVPVVGARGFAGGGEGAGAGARFTASTRFSPPAANAACVVIILMGLCARAASLVGAHRANTLAMLALTACPTGAPSTSYSAQHKTAHCSHGSVSPESTTYRPNTLAVSDTCIVRRGRGGGLALDPLLYSCSSLRRPLARTQSAVDPVAGSSPSMRTTSGSSSPAEPAAAACRCTSPMHPASAATALSAVLNPHSSCDSRKRRAHLSLGLHQSPG
jgi:hypothetical protein